MAGVSAVHPRHAHPVNRSLTCPQPGDRHLYTDCNCPASLLSADHSPRRKRLNCGVAPTSQPGDAGLWVVTTDFDERIPGDHHEGRS